MLPLENCNQHQYETRLFCQIGRLLNESKHYVTVTFPMKRNREKERMVRQKGATQLVEVGIALYIVA